MTLVGFALAVTWALQAGATNIPGMEYIALPIVFGLAAAVSVWRASSPRRRHRRVTTKNGVTMGLCSWAVAATFSAAMHWHTDHVPLTYV